MSKNSVCYWGLASHDAEATVAFLQRGFEWEVTLARTQPAAR